MKTLVSLLLLSFLLFSSSFPIRAFSESVPVTNNENASADIQQLEGDADQNQQICDVQDSYQGYMKALSLATNSQDRVRLQNKATHALMLSLPSVIRLKGRDNQSTNRSQAEQEHFRQTVREHLYRSIADRPTKVRKSFPPGFTAQDVSLVSWSQTPFNKLLVGSEEPGSLKNNKFSTVTGSYKSGYEAALRQKILASLGNLLPGDVATMALEVTGNNYPLAMLTAHNLLKNVAYISRTKLENYRHYLDPVTKTFRKTESVPPELKTYANPDDYLKPEGDVAAKLRNLRRHSCYATNGDDKMGQWYHIFAVMTAASWTSTESGYAAVYGENSLRVLDHFLEELTQEFLPDVTVNVPFYGEVRSRWKASFSKLDVDKEAYDFMAASVAKDIESFLAEGGVENIIPTEESPEVAHFSQTCAAQHDYFRQEAYRTTHENGFLTPEQQKHLETIKQELDEQEEALRQTQEFLKDKTVQVLELEKLLDIRTQPCQEFHKSLADLPALMNMMVRNGDAVEKQYQLAQALVSQCSDNTALQKSQAAYRDAEHLVSTIVKDEQSVLSLTRLASKLEVDDEKLSEARELYRDVRNQGKELNDREQRLQGLISVDLNPNNTVTVTFSQAMRDKAGELTQRLADFTQRFEGKVPADMLAQCTGSLQLYINGLQGRADAWDDNPDEVKNPFEVEAVRANELLQEIRAVARIMEKIQDALYKKDSCSFDPATDLSGQQAQAEEIRAIAIAAQQILGKGALEMQAKCKSKTALATTGGCQGAACPPRTKPVHDPNAGFNKKLLPAYIIRFLQDTDPKNPFEAMVLSGSTAKNGYIAITPTYSMSASRYKAQTLGHFNDINSICAIVRAYGETSIGFPGAEAGQIITCKGYTGPIAPRKSFIQDPVTGLERPDAWNDPQIQALIDEWLANAIPPLDPNKYQGTWRYTEWGIAKGPGTQIVGPPDHPAGWSRHQVLWAKRTRFDSLNLCTLGMYVERRFKGQNVGDCKKTLASSPMPSFIKETGGIQGTPPQVKPPVIAGNTLPTNIPANPSSLNTSSDNQPTSVARTRTVQSVQKTMQTIREAKSTQVPRGFIVETSKGAITIEFIKPDYFPKTLKFFTNLIQQGYYQHGMTFHRFVPRMLIQTGDPTNRGDGGVKENIALETISLPAQVPAGAVGLAHGRDPNIASSQFFILVAPVSQAQLSNFSIFGRVITGMTVVQSIQQGDRVHNVRLFYNHTPIPADTKK